MLGACDVPRPTGFQSGSNLGHPYKENASALSDKKYEAYFFLNSLLDHDGPVSVIATSPTLGDIATVSTSKEKKHNSKECVHGRTKFQRIVRAN